jgi:hypothetical protein
VALFDVEAEDPLCGFDGIGAGSALPAKIGVETTCALGITTDFSNDMTITVWMMIACSPKDPSVLHPRRDR